MYLTQALHRSVQQHPDRIAVRFGDRRRTFRELADRVARLAGALQGLGLRDGDRVAMLSLNSDRYLEYQVGVPWGGGVLNPCNIRWSPAEILYSLEDSGSTILLVDDTFKHLIAQFRRDSTTLREVVYCGDGAAPADCHDYEALLAESAPVPDVLRRGNDLAGIFYTGGTTGFPKGVMLSHDNMGWPGRTRSSSMPRRCSTWPTWASRCPTGSRGMRTRSSRHSTLGRCWTSSSATGSPT